MNQMDFSHVSMSRRSFLGGVGVAAAAALSGCGGETPSDPVETDSPAPSGDNPALAEVPETSTIHWARANSGNIFVTLGQKKGYFAEYGLEVIENPVQNDVDAMTSLSSGKVDVTSNQGTVTPLQHIASGEDFTIVGGYMLQGMYMVARTGTFTYNGPEDLVGKKIAHKAPQIPVCYALDQIGEDPLTAVEWVQTDTGADRLTAAITGEADLGYLSGDLLYQVGQNPDVEIVVYADELMPAYGCCRMNMRTEFVENNPTTVKLLLKALIRAEAYFQANKDEACEILAEELNTTPEFCAAYLKNEHYVISIDPVRNQVLKSWDIMKKINYVDEEQAKTDVDGHINTSIYKTALDEVIAEHGDEYPEWWAGRQEFFDEYNV